MNIEIANRLVNLRKSNNLSQEALAEKLGISRQAVSKWERAEASPDTDNLILLARLYGVSLDELLRTEDEIPRPEAEDEGVSQNGWENDNRNSAGGNASGGERDDESVHVGLNGIYVKDKSSEVHVGWNGIYVNDKVKGDNVRVDKNGIYVNGERRDREWVNFLTFPIALIVIVAYLVMGFGWNAWHPGWIIFLVIPVCATFFEAIAKRDASHFAYPVLVTMIYLYLGFMEFLWHPGWVIYLTIPIYYFLVEWLKGIKTAD